VKLCWGKEDKGGIKGKYKNCKIKDDVIENITTQENTGAEKN